MRVFSFSILPDKRNPNRSPPPILYVLVAKKLNQQLLLSRYPARKEHPQHRRIREKAKAVPAHQLRADPPPEEAEVAGVAEERVNARGDEDVGLRFGVADDMAEVRAGGQHRHRANGLA